MVAKNIYADLKWNGCLALWIFKQAFTNLPKPKTLLKVEALHIVIWEVYPWKNSNWDHITLFPPKLFSNWFPLKKIHPYLLRISIADFGFKVHEWHLIVKNKTYTSQMCRIIEFSPTKLQPYLKARIYCICFLAPRCIQKIFWWM